MQEVLPYQNFVAHPYIYDATLFDSRFIPLRNKAHSFTPYQHEAALTSKLDLHVFPDLQAVQYFLAYLQHKSPAHHLNNHDALFSETGSSAHPNGDRLLPDRCALTSDRAINTYTRCCGEIKPSYKWSSEWFRTLAPDGNMQLQTQYTQVLSQVKGYMTLCGTNADGLAPVYGYVMTEKEVALVKRFPGQGMNPGAHPCISWVQASGSASCGRAVGDARTSIYLHLLAGSKADGLAIP